MRKIEIGVICIALCIAVALMLPQVGVSKPTVDSLCLGCHTVGTPAVAGDDIHGNHTAKSCTDCHAVVGDTPATSMCIVCHPASDPGKCELTNISAHTGSCASCHDSECGDTTETTTTAMVTTTTTVAVVTTTTAATCPSQEIYGENSAEVQVLRFVRDNVLAATPEGREIIRLYYQLSPIIVAAMQNDPAFKAEVKAMSDGVLQLVVQ